MSAQRVAFVLPNLHFGGAERVMSQLAAVFAGLSTVSSLLVSFLAFGVMSSVHSVQYFVILE
jgi:hypothetical protein